MQLLIFFTWILVIKCQLVYTFMQFLMPLYNQGLVSIRNTKIISSWRYSFWMELLLDLLLRMVTGFRLQLHGRSLVILFINFVRNKRITRFFPKGICSFLGACAANPNGAWSGFDRIWLYEAICRQIIYYFVY